MKKLIRENLKVNSFLSYLSNFTLCGTPELYELNKNFVNNKIDFFIKLFYKYFNK